MCLGTACIDPSQVKTRYQSNLAYGSVGECVKDLYHAEGLRGFFRGFGWRLVWGIALTASAFGAIESLNGWWAMRQARLRAPAAARGLIDIVE